MKITKVNADGSVVVEGGATLKLPPLRREDFDLRSLVGMNFVVAMRKVLDDNKKISDAVIAEASQRFRKGL